jgi:hypothetical protein
MPALVHVPRDLDNIRQGLPRRRMYELDPNVMISLYAINREGFNQLNFPEEYRLELSRAFSEVYLLRGGAAVASVMYHCPLRLFRDPARYQRARDVCNGQDPIQTQLNPVLLQSGQHPF